MDTNCIQVLLGIGISVTPSVFAYSMLYPYTDNFLDAGKVSERQKRETNDRLEKGWVVSLSDLKLCLRTGCSNWWR